MASAFVALLVWADLPTRKPFPGHARVKLSIHGPDGRPTGLRLRVTNAAGDYFAPLGHLPVPDATKRSAGDVILGDGGLAPLELHALVYNGAQIDLPPGRYTFAARRGLEYELVRKPVEITAAEGQTVDLPLRKFADFEAMGWYPGDTHMHFPDPSGVRYEMECEGLRVCSLLLLKSGYKTGRPGDGHFWNAEHFTGKLDPVSGAGHFVKVGEEFRHGLLAHLIFQNLKSIVWPVSTGGLRESGVGGFDWPLMLHASDDAHQQGALVTWAHWPYPSMEAPLDIALGRIDSLDILTTGNPFEHHPILVDIYKMHGPSAYTTPPIEMYYHYLNCGFRLAASSGSDKMATNPPMGSARTYVKTDGPLSYDSWIEGIRKGRTFISTYPLLEFTVNGKEAGETLALPPGKAKLEVKARARSLEPYQVLEILVNGQVLARATPSGGHHEARIDTTLEVQRGGWIAARAHGPKMLEYGATWWKMPVFAHTSPIYLQMPGRPAPSAASAKILLEQLGYLRRWAESRANFPAPESKAEALSLIAQAEAIYEKLRDIQ
ncbi:MAG: CehA/McbA family metallohydrolase [Candidatus Solibacter usitatus]|nr:CehA/McbA family metallohydrolase [Candidatus Solibacter usitatus]